MANASANINTSVSNNNNDPPNRPTMGATMSIEKESNFDKSSTFSREISKFESKDNVSYSSHSGRGRGREATLPSWMTHSHRENNSEILTVGNHVNNKTISQISRNKTSNEVQP